MRRVLIGKTIFLLPKEMLPLWLLASRPDFEAVCGVLLLLFALRLLSLVEALTTPPTLLPFPSAADLLGKLLSLLVEKLFTISLL